MDILKYRANKKRNILIVEDDATLSRIYKEILAKEGYRVLTAKNGKSAKNILTWNIVDLVLLDIMLPDMSGIDILKFLREQKADIKVVVLTNNSNTSISDTCIELGVSMYLYKSEYTPQELLTCVERALGMNILLASL